MPVVVPSTRSRRGRALVTLIASLTMTAGSASAVEVPPLPEPPPLPVPVCSDPAADPLNCIPIDYRIETVYRQPDGTLRRTTVEGAKMLVPEAVDATGDLLPDVLVQLQIDAGRATVRTSRLAAAPEVLPLAVETVLADPRGNSPLRVSFGYDALADDAPGVYDGTLGLLGTGRVTSFALDTHVVDAASTLAVTAAVFSEGPNRERIDPQSGRLTFSPVPVVAHFDVLVGSDLGVDQSGINVVTDTPTRVDIEIRSVDGSDEVRADIVVDRLPNSVTITYSNLTTGQASLNYNASDFIGLIDIRVSSYEAAALVKDLQIRFEDMPLQVAIVQDSPTHATAQATGAIGRVRVGIADDGVPLFLDDSAYVYATDTAGYDSLAFQLNDLSAAELGTGDPLVLGLTLRPEPLHVVVRDGTLDVDAWVRDMPETFRIEASTTAGTIGYEGSSPIAELTVDATDPTGIGGDATALHLLMRDIPTVLDLSYAPDGDTVSLDAGTGSLGLLEVQLTNGPNNRLDPGVDGIRLDDTAGGYEMFGRVTGLKRVVARTVPEPSLELDTLGGRVFVVHLSEQSGSKVAYTRATLDHLVPSVRVSVQGNNITYTASAPTKSLTFDTNSGDRWNLHASVGNPLPASFTLCQSSSISCTPVADRTGRSSAGSGSVRMTASEHTTVNVFDCVRPLSSACTPGGATEFTKVTNLKVRVLGEDAHCSSLCFSGHIFFDTDNHELTGTIENRNTSGGGFRAVFPAGFKSQNRLSRWDFWFFLSKSGSITCPPGTALDVRLLGAYFGVSNYLC